MFRPVYLHSVCVSACVWAFILPPAGRVCMVQIFSWAADNGPPPSSMGSSLIRSCHANLNLNLNLNLVAGCDQTDHTA
jgi:hypothetical protein